MNGIGVAAWSIIVCQQLCLMTATYLGHGGRLRFVCGVYARVLGWALFLFAGLLLTISFRVWPDHKGLFGSSFGMLYLFYNTIALLLSVMKRRAREREGQSINNVAEKYKDGVKDHF